MINSRHGNTAREIATDGDWMKLGKKHYLHGSGREVRYDCDRWGWEVVGLNELYTTLWAAKHRAERVATHAA